jgi:HAD superfamily hydrolase (TIGR01450 family)
MRFVTATLRGSARPLVEVYDSALLDLDGVVYVGPDPVPGVSAALSEARARGIKLAFVTNNASRTPEAVARRLVDLGVEARADEVITSAQAAARYLAEHLDLGARVLIVGTDALSEAVCEQGLTAQWEAESDGAVVDAVVQGYSPDTTWRMLAEGAVAIERGALWVATNTDATVPSRRGPLPGNGALVAALRHATGAEPTVTGKPDPTMHRELMLRTGADNPLVVGDRLDTDIEGANAVGCDSLLVLSGVTTPAQLLSAPARLRPSYLAADAAGLLDRHPEPTLTDDGGAVCRRAQVRNGRGGWELVFDGRAERENDAGEQAGDDALDALRALCVAHWSRLGRGEDTTTHSSLVQVSARDGDDRAAQALDRLGLRSGS